MTNPTSIKTWRQRCDELHDDMVVVSSRLVQQRMQEEIDDLRAALERAHEPSEKPIVHRCMTFSESGFNLQCTLEMGHNGQCIFQLPRSRLAEPTHEHPTTDPSTAYAPRCELQNGPRCILYPSCVCGHSSLNREASHE